MNLQKVRRRLSWVIAFVATVAAAFFLYGEYIDSQIFRVIDSPTGEYRVRLHGQESRPLWFTVNVYFDVEKDGETFWKKELFHSGDAMDISFELGWPDSRWVENNVLQFYRSQDVIEGSLDEIRISNLSGRQIPRVWVHSDSKILAFDIAPNSTIGLNVPKPKGDFCEVWVKVDFGARELQSSAVTPHTSGACRRREIILSEQQIQIISQEPTIPLPEPPKPLV